MQGDLYKQQQQQEELHIQQEQEQLQRQEQLLAAPQEMAEDVDVCPECGMSWDDFQRNGFLGCDACYDHFKDALPSLMQRLHSDAAETIPAEASAAEAAPVSAKAHPESELQRAIAAENFEEAAQLRDAIRALEAAENGDGSTD